MPKPLDISRQTASKVLSYIVTDFFPGAQLAGTGITPIGFYSDFILTQPIDEKALPLIEERMRGAIKSALPIKTMEMMRKNAAAFLKHHKQYHLADLTLDQPSDMVELVEIGHFHDLMLGECGATTSEAGSIKLLSISPSGDAVRIQGTCFPDNQKLKQFLKALEASKKRDHRVIGPEMRLFEELEGKWLWYPKGMFIKNTLIAAAQEGQPVEWKGDEVVLKKMIHLSEELPSSYYEVVRRKGKAGWGLFEAGYYSRDEVYLFYSAGDLRNQLISSLHFINKTAKIFSFEYHWHLVVPSKKEPNRTIMEQALREAGCDYDVTVGEKLCAEMRVADILGREWSVGLLNVNPGVITRSLYGSVERFVALLIEKYAGKFPLWLAPEQVRVVPIGDKPAEYAKRVHDLLKAKGFRAGIAYGNEALGAKVHAAERERVPYLVIVGDKEEKNEKVTMRSCYQEAVESGLKLDDVIARLSDEIDSEGLKKSGE
jgi:threonyl-tRNA synthetase